MRRSNAGVLLIVLGAVVALVQFGGWGMGQSWPVFVLAPGAVLLSVAWLGGPERSALAIPGSIVSTVGAILLVQNLTGAFHTWAYAWGLIIAGSGAGQWFHGHRTQQAAVEREGRRGVTVGLTAFAAFGVLFEVVLGIGGRGSLLGDAALPVVLIAAGVLLLVWQRRSAP